MNRLHAGAVWLGKQKTKSRKRLNKTIQAEAIKAAAIPPLMQSPKRGQKDPFYASRAWKLVRYIALKRAAGHCQCCGVGPEHGALLNVDHIKPRRRFPELSLDPDNLQVLCGNCNTGKGSWDTTDWRKERVDPEIAADIEHLSLLRESGLLN